MVRRNFSTVAIFASWQAYIKYVKELLLHLHQLVQCNYTKQVFSLGVEHLLILLGPMYCVSLSCPSASGSCW